MRKQIHPTQVILAALCAFCLGGLSVFANTHRLQRERGTIESIEAKDNKLTVREAHNHSTQVFSWNQDTKFLEHERLLSKPKTITATNLKPGEHVSIFYEKEENQWLARKIVVTRDDEAATHHKGANHSQS